MNYKRQGIPSSFRKDPTNAVVEFISWLEMQRNKKQKAADLGCDLGRNVFLFSQSWIFCYRYRFITRQCRCRHERSSSNKTTNYRILLKMFHQNGL